MRWNVPVTSLQMLRRPGGEAVVVVVVLVPGSHGVEVVEGVLDVAGDTGPEDRGRNTGHAVAAAVVKVHHGGEPPVGE